MKFYNSCAMWNYFSNWIQMNVCLAYLLFVNHEQNINASPNGIGYLLSNGFVFNTSRYTVLVI